MPPSLWWFVTAASGNQGAAFFWTRPSSQLIPPWDPSILTLCLTSHIHVCLLLPDPARWPFRCLGMPSAELVQHEGVWHRAVHTPTVMGTACRKAWPRWLLLPSRQGWPNSGPALRSLCCFRTLGCPHPTSLVHARQRWVRGSFLVLPTVHTGTLGLHSDDLAKACLHQTCGSLGLEATLYLSLNFLSPVLMTYWCSVTTI